MVDFDLRLLTCRNMSIQYRLLFMKNYMRDFNDYIKPFMDMHIRNLSITPKNELHREHEI